MPEETLSRDLFDQDKLEEPPSIADSNQASRKDDRDHDGIAADVAQDRNDQGEGVEFEDPALKHLCSEIYARISAFLQDEPPDQKLRDVQRQIQTSLRVIREALDQYS